MFETFCHVLYVLSATPSSTISVHPSKILKITAHKSNNWLHHLREYDFNNGMKSSIISPLIYLKRNENIT